MTNVGLRARITLAISALIAAIAVFFALYFPARQRETAQTALEQRASGITAILARLVIPSLEFDNAEDAGNQVAAVRDLADLRYAFVLKADGATYARYLAKGVSVQPLLEVVTAERALVRDDTLHVSVPLRSKDAQIGTLVAGFSTETVHRLHQMSQRTAVMVSVAVFVIGLLVAWLLSLGLAGPLFQASRHLDKLSRELVGAARAQEAATSEQAAAIEETRRTMEMLLGSAQQIAESSSAVLGNAERAVDGNRQVGLRIRELNVHAEKVAEILATIMQVADRTDLLALNASLEGTKAGEAGRGFALVAAEMRRLAESVMESVTGIRRLMNDVRSASQLAVQAGQEGMTLSEQTTRSAGEIALVTQQQRKATEQVGRSMDEMGGAVNNTMANTRQTARTAADMANLAGRLGSLIGRAAGQAAGEAAQRSVGP